MKCSMSSWKSFWQIVQCEYLYRFIFFILNFWLFTRTIYFGTFVFHLEIILTLFTSKSVLGYFTYLYYNNYTDAFTWLFSKIAYLYTCIRFTKCPCLTPKLSSSFDFVYWSFLSFVQHFQLLFYHRHSHGATFL